MTIQLDVQIVTEYTDVPHETDFENWANAVPSQDKTGACLRVVDEQEAKNLNKLYRNIDKATNVLSFPAELPTHIGIKFLGDIVICAQVVHHEAQQQNKELMGHWAHLLVHGLLHLQGYDHEENQAAEKMEALEVKILKALHIPNPYE